MGLGAHILAQLLERYTIHCLLRGSEPFSRLQKSLKRRHLRINNQAKLSVLTSNLSHPKRGLTDSTYTNLLSKVTQIIYCARPVNFQLAMSASEPSIQGLQNLLQLSLNVNFSTLARFFFCFSIPTALENPPIARVPEAPIENLEQVSSQDMLTPYLSPRVSCKLPWRKQVPMLRFSE